MTEKDKEPVSDETKLSEEIVWSMLDFAKSSTGWGAGMGMPVTPDLLNQRLKELTLLNTGEVTQTQVSDALLAPKSSEQELQRQSHSFDTTSQIYKRLLSYMANIPSWDYTYTCTNAEASDYKKPAYKKALKIVKEFMDSFDHKAEFAKVAHQLMRQEASFYSFRDTGDKFVLQELPSDKIKITGRWDYGILYSFDYTYFLQSGVDINLFPDIFKKTLSRFYNEGEGAGIYNPTSGIQNRGYETFTYWADCSPVDGFWAFKFTPEIITRIPFFVGMFPDLVQEGVIRALQESSYMAAASKIIFGEVPMLSGKATVKDAISISPILLGQFIQLIKSALDSTAVKVAAAPLENLQSFDFKADPDIRSSYLKTVLGASGSSSNLLFATDVKQNMMETQLSLAVDTILVEAIYPQFNNFLNWQINKRTKSANKSKKNYKFEIKLEGNKFFPYRERILEETTGLAALGMVLPQRFAVAVGMTPFEFQRQLEEAKASGFVDGLTPIVLASQIAKEDSAGAPAKKSTKIGEAGAQTRDDGGNTTK